MCKKQTFLSIMSSTAFLTFLMTHHKEQSFLEILRRTQPYCQAKLSFSICVNHRKNCEVFPSSTSPWQYIWHYSCVLTLRRASFYLGSFLCPFKLVDVLSFAAVRSGFGVFFFKFRGKNLKPCGIVGCVYGSLITFKMINGVFNSTFWLIFLFSGAVCILASIKFTCTTVSFGVVFFLCYSFAYQVGFFYIGQIF